MPDGDAEAYDAMYQAQDAKQQDIDQWREANREHALEAAHGLYEIVLEFCEAYPGREDDISDFEGFFGISTEEIARWKPQQLRRINA